MANQDRNKVSLTEQKEGISVKRRGYMKLIGATATAIAVGTTTGIASENNAGYGAGGYGSGAYGGEIIDEETTDKEETFDPSIDTFDVTESGKPNPHAEFQIDWAVSDPDGELEEAIFRIRNIDGRLIETETTTVDSDTASGAQDLKVKHHTEDTYYVTLKVTDKFENMDSRTTRIEI